MEEPQTLAPPKREGLGDSGTKDLAESSESDDHFSDAPQSAPLSPVSPLPRTRVEKVDDDPSYGEVPGTEAYRQREGDAEPDEIAVVADPESHSSKSDTASAPSSSGGETAPPKTVVEESSGTPDEQSDEFKERRMADADADEVVKADDTADVPTPEDTEGTTIFVPAGAPLTPFSPRARRKSSKSATPSGPESSGLAPTATGEDTDDDEDFGDDFDDFEEGGDDADFDDFEDGFQQPHTEGPPTPAPPPVMPTAALPFPIPDFEGLDTEDILGTADPYLNALFAPEDLDLPTLPPLPKENPFFLNPRSASLWSQLVAPPPLAPPDWIRSRIRRLFLVSLGVPVDLDEILPASKQNKLVLPSVGIRSVSPGGSRRTSTDSRSVSRLRQSEANASSTSLDSKGNPKRAKSPSQQGKGATSRSSKSGGRTSKSPPAPELDLVAARQLATTTDEAIDGMTDEELKQHVERLTSMKDQGEVVLGFWKKKADEKIGDREAFEGVIENLVKHARNSRK